MTKISSETNRANQKNPAHSAHHQGKGASKSTAVNNAKQAGKASGKK